MNSQEHQSHIEQVEAPNFNFTPIMEHHLLLGGVGLVTMFFMSLLIREIRLLVKACKS